LLLGGSSPYTSTVYIRINIHKRNNTKNTVQTIQNEVNTSTHITKTQYKRYKTQYIQVHILPKHSTNDTKRSKYKYTYYQNTVQTIQNEVNTSTHITKTQYKRYKTQ